AAQRALVPPRHAGRAHRAQPAGAEGPRPAAPPEADVDAATACDQAKQQVLDADTDEAFTLAERRMRLLCGE
ncbi:MAG TPA: hypothetical protein PLO41_15550, partial [Rubrivivax sp.]|nr:hypothetical protein [Rubrivivax sp.]